MNFIFGFYLYSRKRLDNIYRKGEYKLEDSFKFYPDCNEKLQNFVSDLKYVQKFVVNKIIELNMVFRCSKYWINIP